MPVERRSTLRSNKSETSSSANSGKPRSDSQSSGNKKDRPAPTKSGSSRPKSVSSKKGNTLARDMSGDKPQINGTDSPESIDGSEDVEMDDDGSRLNRHSKPGKDKDGDEEMTVVVPPSKGSKLSGKPSEDDGGDVSMNGTEEAVGEEDGRVSIDPKVKAVSGRRTLFNQH